MPVRGVSALVAEGAEPNGTIGLATGVRWMRDVDRWYGVDSHEIARVAARANGHGATVAVALLCRVVFARVSTTGRFQ